MPALRLRCTGEPTFIVRFGMSQRCQWTKPLAQWGAAASGMSVPGWNDGRFLPDDEGPEACPQNRRSVSMMIARSIIDGVGSAANVARRHLHRGQFRTPEPMRLEMQP